MNGKVHILALLNSCWSSFSAIDDQCIYKSNVPMSSSLPPPHDGLRPINLMGPYYGFGYRTGYTDSYLKQNP